MPRVSVRILHAEPEQHTGDLSRLLARARGVAAADLARRFAAAGADDVRVVASPPNGRSFGARMRDLVRSVTAGGPGGLVILGSGSIPLASDADLERLVSVASSGEAVATTNNRYSSDVLAIGDASCLASVPDVPVDNVLPRWLETRGGVVVHELADRSRLAMDLDSPLDIELLSRHAACPPAIRELRLSVGGRFTKAVEALDELGVLASDPRREILVGGRLSARTLSRLESGTACRVRALVEERGLRASWEVADGEAPGREPGRNDAVLPRPPASLLGMLLDRDGPDAIARIVRSVADGALLDSRVLLAHRHGVDEARWPPPEDRFASDLLLAGRVRDPWLRELTLGASAHRVPVALGGHTLVGPGLPLALGMPDP